MLIPATGGAGFIGLHLVTAHRTAPRSDIAEN
jgi:hypothetical protein